MDDHSNTRYNRATPKVVIQTKPPTDCRRSGVPGDPKTDQYTQPSADPFKELRAGGSTPNKPPGRKVLLLQWEFLSHLSHPCVLA